MFGHHNMTFGDLGQLFDGPHATPKRMDSGPYFLNISSLNAGRLDLDQSDHVSEDDFLHWTRRVTPQENDLLFSYETRLGEAALMPGGVQACLGRRMALMRPNCEVVHPRFLLYYYLSPSFQQLIEQHTIHGATVNRIGLSTMGNWPISIPPLDEQRAIAEVLGALDDRIAANTKLAETADALAISLVRSHFTGKKQPLNEIASVIMGSSPTGETLNESGLGTVFYQGVRDFGFRFPANRIWTTSPTRMAEPGDTLVSVRAPVGRVNLASERTCIGRGLASVRSTRDTPSTLFHLLQASTDIWEPYEAEGTVFGSINRKQLETIQVPMLETGTALEAEIASIEGTIRISIEENRTLAATRDALLPQLMSGKLRVKDIEHTMGEMV